MSGFDNIVITASENSNGEIKFIQGEIGYIKSKFNKNDGVTPENKCIAVCVKILSKNTGITINTQYTGLSTLLAEINITGNDLYDGIKTKIADAAAAAGGGGGSAVSTVSDEEYITLLRILEAKLGVTAAAPALAPAPIVTEEATESVTKAPAATESVTKAPAATESVTAALAGGSAQTLMNHIIDNKPNMTSMYPVKVTRRRYYRNSRGRRNGGNNRTNRRRRRSYTRR